MSVDVRPVPVSASRPGTVNDTAEVVESVLDRVLDPREALGPDTLLTGLGMDSVTAVRVQRELRTATGVAVPLNTFVGATVGDLVQVVSDAAPSADAPTSSAPSGPAAAAVAGPVADAPLTSVQAAYWVGRRPELPFGGVSAFYYTEWRRTPAGDQLADAHALRDAWDRVVARHGALRSVVDDRARQRVLPHVPAGILDVVDLRDLPADAAVARADELRHTWSHQARPTDQWPLFDVHAVLLPDGTTRVCLGTEAMMLDLDGWRTIVRDWGTLLDDPHGLPEPPALDFPTALTRREAGRADRVRQDEAYWRQTVPQLPAQPALPWITERKPAGANRFERRTNRLDADTWAALREQASRRGLSPTGVLLSAFALVLSRWGAAAPFTLATTVFDRPDDELAVVGDWTTIGLTAVEPPALGHWDGFAAFAEQVNRRFWADLEHGGVAANAVRPPRVEAGGLPDHGVVFTSGLMDDVQDPDGWLGEEEWGVSQTPQVLLDHLVDERAGGLRIRWDSVQGILPADLLDSMVAAERRLLTHLATSPDAWDDRTLGWDPTFEGPRSRNPSPFTDAGDLIADPWRASARANPDAVAVSGVVGTERREVTHGRLLELAEQGAEALRGLGVGPETLVAVSLPKGPAQIAAILSVSLAGGAYVPVDPAWPAERCVSICRQSGSTLALVAPGADPSRWPDGVRTVEVSGEGALDVEGVPPATAPDTRPTDGDLAYAIFTSGSTGKPKGVAIEHRAARTTIDEIVHLVPLGVGDRVLGLSAASFDLSVHDIFGVMGAGGTLVLPDPDRERDPDHWLELFEQHEVTVWNTAPALMEMLVEHSEFEPDRARRAIASLRLVLLSGDWIPVTLPARLHTLVPGAHFLSLGGATEAAIWSNTFHVGEVDPAWASIPYGRALPGQCFHIVDEHGDPVPAGESGELQISGGGLAREYIGAPEQTAKAFGVEPGLGIRTYRTGDLGRWRHDGQMEFLGRKDRQVKIRGHRIELGEVEAALSRAHGVRAAVASAVPGPDGRPRLVAHVVADDPARPPETDALQSELRRHVPAYMVPASMLFLDALPLTGNGKVDVRALPNPYKHHKDSHAARASASAQAAAAPTMTFTGGATEAGADSAGAVEPRDVEVGSPVPAPVRAAAAAARLTATDLVPPADAARSQAATGTARSGGQASARHGAARGGSVAGVGASVETALAAGLSAELVLTASDDLPASLVAAGTFLGGLPSAARYRVVGMEPFQVEVVLPAGHRSARETVAGGTAPADGAAGRPSGRHRRADGHVPPTAPSTPAAAPVPSASPSPALAPTTQPAPAPGRRATAPGVRGARSRIAAVMRDLLEEDIAEDTPFLDAGATSLTVVLAHGRLRSEPGFEGLQLMDFFDHPSVAALAEHVVSSAAEPASVAGAEPTRPAPVEERATEQPVAPVEEPTGDLDVQPPAEAVAAPSLEDPQATEPATSAAAPQTASVADAPGTATEPVAGATRPEPGSDPTTTEEAAASTVPGPGLSPRDAARARRREARKTMGGAR